MKKIVIAGGTGFLGQTLAKYFSQKGYQIIILSRKQQLDTEHIKYFKWDGKTIGYWLPELEGTDVLINLNGRSVDCRYNEANKQEIYDTRIQATYVLNEALKKLQKPPKVWINAASATIYRHAEDRQMDEYTGELGEGFSVDVCKKWEHTFFKEELKNVRKVALRIAIVLGKNGGALEPLVGLVKKGIGGKQGKGNQFVSWLHEDDFSAIVDYVIQNEFIQGIYNASAPNPIRNQYFMKKLRKYSKAFIGLPMPSWLLKIGARMIKTETELILKSRNVIPQKLMDSGYQFQYRTIELALKDLLN